MKMKEALQRLVARLDDWWHGGVYKDLPEADRELFLKVEKAFNEDRVRTSDTPWVCAVSKDLPEWRLERMVAAFSIVVQGEKFLIPPADWRRSMGPTYYRWRARTRAATAKAVN